MMGCVFVFIMWYAKLVYVLQRNFATSDSELGIE